MSQKSKFLLMIFFLLVQHYKSVCLSLEKFEQQNGQNIEAIFNTGVTKSEGTYGDIKSVTFDGKKLAIKKTFLTCSLQSYKEKDKFKLLLEMVKREIALLKKLINSSFFPKFEECVWDIKENEAVIYILQEDFETDLSKNSSALKALKTPKQRIGLYKELAQGLHELEKMRYMHADFKPANVMSTDSNYSHLKIFNLLFSREINSEVVGGLSFYKAPEKIGTNQRNYTAQDVYALGLSISVIEHPQSEKFFDNVQIDCFETYMSPKCWSDIFNESKNAIENVFEVDSEFSKLVLKMIAYHPNQRPTLSYIIQKLNYILNENSDGQKQVIMKANLNDHLQKFNYIQYENNNGQKQGMIPLNPYKIVIDGTKGNIYI